MGTMKLWYTMFILTFIVIYGTLSITLLGSWAYERVKAVKGAWHPPAR
jgi:hypothetical protein